MYSNKKDRLTNVIMVWDASGSASSVYTARCTTPQLPKGVLTQQTQESNRPGQCKTQMEMGAQPLQLKGALQQGSSCPSSGSEQRQCFILLRVNISPGNQIKRKRLCSLPYLTLGMVQSFTASLTILFNYLTLRKVERITGEQVSLRKAY